MHLSGYEGRKKLLRQWQDCGKSCCTLIPHSCSQHDAGQIAKVSLDHALRLSNMAVAFHAM